MNEYIDYKPKCKLCDKIATVTDFKTYYCSYHAVKVLVPQSYFARENSIHRGKRGI